jgi:hypothetical protein
MAIYRVFEKDDINNLFSFAGMRRATGVTL